MTPRRRPARRRRRLRRRQPRQHRPGARPGRRRRRLRPRSPRRSRAPTRSSSRASARPAPAMERLARRGPRRCRSASWIAAGRPFLGICLGLQLLFEGSDEDGAETLGVLPGRTRPARGRARRCPTSAGTRSSGRATTRCSTASRRRRRLLLRPLLRRVAGGPDAERDPRPDRARRAVRSAPSPATTLARRPVPPRAERRRRPAAARQCRRARSGVAGGDAADPHACAA